MLHKGKNRFHADWNLRFHWLVRASSIFFFYAIWTLLFRLLVISFITYFLIPFSTQLSWLGISDASVRLPRFEEISDIFASNELTLIGLSSILYVAFLHGLNPLISTSTRDFFSWKRIRTLYPDGALNGFVFGLGLIVAFLFSGFYKYLGFYVQFDDLILTLPNLLIRIGAIVILVYCEEFLFRHRLLYHLRNGMQRFQPGFGTLTNRSELRPEILAAVLTSVAWCVVKFLQFDLGIMHAITLFLISLLLCFRSIMAPDAVPQPENGLPLAPGGFINGAGFLATLLVVIHVLCSLPILGNDYSGVVILKYYAGPDTEAAIERSTVRFLTGGAGGPFSSLAFQILLLLVCIRSFFKLKKFLLKSNS